MLMLALNCGSSSIKSALLDPAGGPRVDVVIENLGRPSCRLRVGDRASPLDPPLDFDTAVRRVIAEVRSTERAGAVECVAHRVVHGGARFVQPLVIDDESLRAIEALSAMAPLHNPPAVAAIRLARESLPHVRHVAVFDTAFHATLPPHAREYALPAELTTRLGIRRFGFHGASHAHVAQAVAAHLNGTLDALRIVSCHLGNGASVAAIENGRSVETSMGMTPMEGLVMGTRAGDLDPGVLLHLLQSKAVDVAGLDTLLNTGSGLVGLTGTNDMGEIERRASRGDEACVLAIALFSHRVRKYIGAYAAVMGGVDVIAFTGGIGEHSATIRAHCTERLEFLGVELNKDTNRAVRSVSGVNVATISSSGSTTRVLVVHADEELTIAREAAAHLAGIRRSTSSP